jgi:hypothetical protein
MVCEWFDLKTTQMVFAGLRSKPVATVSTGLASKPVATVFTGLTSKPVVTVFFTLTMFVDPYLNNFSIKFEFTVACME